MTSIIVSENKKKMYLLRGVPGSGKSTISNAILSENGIDTSNIFIKNQHILSTDDFFIVKGKYNFDPRKLVQYHNANQMRTEEQMKKGISPLLIDNTNIMPWEMKNYVKLADKYGYETIILNPEDFSNVNNPLVITKKVIN